MIGLCHDFWFNINMKWPSKDVPRVRRRTVSKMRWKQGLKRGGKGAVERAALGAAAGSFTSIENLMEDFSYQIPVCTLHEGIKIISNIKYLTKLHKIPQAAGLQFRQLI
ncbi:hypothetical protein SADUNF_Sadunf16G0307200 [Salix dunnii]|uniref:Uncharacterized protein n=1 Tax=Salix dunnii TaxID=1413687 RepID=A0A835MIJ9_9ROSI|nr:hypothetical protein SADUNF_Sadunf16G0307200 [Salix dunnii]